MTHIKYFKFDMYLKNGQVIRSAVTYAEQPTDAIVLELR